MRTTQRIQTDQLHLAADILKDGGVVAFPTETVYGLGADALNAQAVEKIFVAKGRPSDNPLIVHVSNVEQLLEVGQNISPLANQLIERFWPGPLTIVVQKQPCVPSNVTAGLDTVAVRMPADPTALELIRLTGKPIVAPSANRSGRPSATTWQAVLADLEGRIDGVVCGPATRIGIESTVVDATGDRPIVLRHGAITQEMITEVCGATQSPTAHLQHRSPGTRHRHYQPLARVVLFDSFEHLEPSSQRIGVLAFSPMDATSNDFDEIQSQLHSIFPSGQVRICKTLEDYASTLFDFFRECDALGLHAVYCQKVERIGLGRAIMDRLDRAAERT